MTGAADAVVDLAAIVLAGGRSSRLGTAKAELVIGGERLVDRALAAAESLGTRRIALVGPPRLAGSPGTSGHAVTTVNEDPPFGGPVAGLAAGLAALARDQNETEWVLVLSCDLPLAREAAAALGAALRAAAAAGTDIDGLCLDDGRPQWLAALYRREALVRALAALGDARGASMRTLTTGLRLVSVPDTAGLSADVDTWEDVERARRMLKETP